MTNTKWLTSALMGGVAISVMATGAQAGELSDLKAQLEALQSRVNSIETTPQAALPAGVSAMTVAKGHGSNANWGNESARDAANYNEDRGYTVSINPTADLPAPVTEITVYGYAKLDFSFSNETQDSYQRVFDMSQANGDNEKNRWHAHAAQTRFGIKAKTDTAIGQIRANIEGDFYGSPYGTSTSFRQRHSYGEWDMTPNWTLQAGQTWHLGSLLPIGISTIDFTGPAGVTYSRSPLLALKYKNGPISARFGISNPQRGNADYPNVGGAVQYTSAGGHELIIAGEIADWDRDSVAAVPAGFAFDPTTGGSIATAAVPAVSSKSGTGYGIGGGANINLGDLVTITSGAYYGQGSVARYLNQGFGFSSFDANGNPTKQWGATIGASMSVNEATTINASFGYTDQKESLANTGGTGCGVAATGRNASCVTDVMTVHANVLWRPVKQMRLGWEVQWGRNDYYTAKSNNVARGQFGAWFFF